MGAVRCVLFDEAFPASFAVLVFVFAPRKSIFVFGYMQIYEGLIVCIADASKFNFDAETLVYRILFTWRSVVQQWCSRATVVVACGCEMLFCLVCHNIF